MILTHLKAPATSSYKPRTYRNKWASALVEASLSPVVSSDDGELDRSLSSHVLKRPRSRTASKIKSFYLNHTTLAVYFIFMAYLVLGAAILIAIESIWTPKLDFARTVTLKDCLIDRGYWSAICFVVSAASTIGFGNVYPCTDMGRAVSTIFSIVGIPMVVYILSNFGRHMCIQIIKIYPKIRKLNWRIRNLKWFRAKKKVHRRKLGLERPLLSNMTDITSCDGLSGDVRDAPVYTNAARINEINDNLVVVDEEIIKKDESEDMAPGDAESDDIPTTIGVMLTLACVACIAGYYGAFEGYNKQDAIYYAFMTFLGGDFVTQNFNWVVPVYIMIFLGFSMLSLTISIFQSNMEKFVNSVKMKLMESVTKRIEEARATTGDPSSIDVDAAVEEALKKSRGPWWMKSAFPQAQLDKLKETVASAVNRKDIGSQAQLENRKRVIVKSTVGVQFGRRSKANLTSQTVTRLTEGTSMQAPETSTECVECKTIRKHSTTSMGKKHANASTQKKVVFADSCDLAKACRSDHTTSMDRKFTENGAQTYHVGPCVEVQAGILQVRRLPTPTTSAASSRRSSVQSRKQDRSR